MTTDRHGRSELALFKEFVACCPLPINVESVQRRNPPEPDLRCEIDGLGAVAFELVSLTDNDAMRWSRDAIRFPGYINEEISCRSAAFQNALRSRMGDASMTIEFDMTLSLSQRRAAIPAFVDWLVTVPPRFEGIWPMADAPLGGAIHRVTIWHTSAVHDGPVFGSPATSYQEPVRDVIAAKLRKRYVIDVPTELLAYFLLAGPPTEGWWRDLCSYLDEALSESVFRRVWVFDRTFDRIRVFPEI